MIIFDEKEIKTEMPSVKKWCLNLGIVFDLKQYHRKIAEHMFSKEEMNLRWFVFFFLLKVLFSGILFRVLTKDELFTSWLTPVLSGLLCRVQPNLLSPTDWAINRHKVLSLNWGCKFALFFKKKMKKWTAFWTQALSISQHERRILSC